MAGRGAGARRLPVVREAFASVGATEVLVTGRAGDERPLAHRAIDAGFTTIAVLGGDGTWSKVAEAVIESGADPRLALVAAGTGNDFAKSLGIPARDAAAMARLAASGPDLRVDVGRVGDRRFLNVVGFGFDAAVVEDMLRPGWLRGESAYLAAALRQLLGYRGFSLAVDGGEAGQLLLAAIANGRHFGGRFQIAPGASFQDGVLDLVAVAHCGSLRRLGLFVAATSGRHIGAAEVVTYREREYVLRFAEPPVYQLDGELVRGVSPELRVVCEPAAVRMVVQLTSL